MKESRGAQAGQPPRGASRTVPAAGAPAHARTLSACRPPPPLNPALRCLCRWHWVTRTCGIACCWPSPRSTRELRSARRSARSRRREAQRQQGRLAWRPRMPQPIHMAARRSRCPVPVPLPGGTPCITALPAVLCCAAQALAQRRTQERYLRLQAGEFEEQRRDFESLVRQMVRQGGGRRALQGGRESARRWHRSAGGVLSPPAPLRPLWHAPALAEQLHMSSTIALFPHRPRDLRSWTASARRRPPPAATCSGRTSPTLRSPRRPTPRPHPRPKTRAPRAWRRMPRMLPSPTPRTRHRAARAAPARLWAPTMRYWRLWPGCTAWPRRERCLPCRRRCASWCRRGCACLSES
jgi:hypothetical protein